MKRLMCAFLFFAAFTAGAQEKAISPAEKGTVYGTTANGNPAAITTDELEQKASAAAYNGRVTGKVTEVCQSMGCWFKLQKSDGSALMVKTKDHAFFLPQNLVGKTVAVDGSAQVKEVTEAQRRHLAEDAGKSKAEVAKIKGSEKQVQVIAAGVQVLD